MSVCVEVISLQTVSSMGGDLGGGYEDYIGRLDHFS